MELGVESSGPPIKDIEMAPRPSVSVALPSPVGAPPSIGVRPISTQLGVPELEAVVVSQPQPPLQQAPAVVDVNGEVWLEQKTPDNRVCYVSRLSGMIRWERPQIASQMAPQMAPQISGISTSVSSIAHQSTESPGHFPLSPVFPAGLPPTIRQPTATGLLAFSATRPPFPIQLPFQATRLPSGVPPLSMTSMPFPLPFAPIWSEYAAANGRKYYFNRVTQQSTWEKPADIQTVVPFPPPIMPLSSVSLTTTNMPFAPPAPSVLSAPPPAIPPPTASTPTTSETTLVTTETKATEQPKSGIEEDNKEKEQPPEKEKEQPTDRPIASRPIPGKAWRIVFTGDERVFFFNPISKVSVWEVPKELSSVTNLGKLMEPPGGKTESDDSDMGDEQEEDNSGGIEGAGEEGEEPAAKKAKTEGESDTNIETLSAEDRAASLRATLSVEERQQLFQDMLRERTVSAFSTWDKELPRFVFDERYLLLTPRERRGAFDVYVKTRAEEERREKSKKFREKKDDYRKLLEESKLTVKSTFSEFSNRHGRDSRFKGIEKMREREALFNEFLTELKARQKEEAREQEEKVRTDFFAMLSERRSLKPRSSWNKVRGKFEHDKRYKTVDGSRMRETLFQEYIMRLAQDGDEGNNDEESKKDRERRERMETSLREREKEVRKAREDQSKEWHVSREQHRKEETLGGFKAFLTDMVRDSELSWRDAKHVLKKDHRWSDFSLLESSERQQLFEEHIHLLKSKKRKGFHQMLRDAKVSLTSTWKEIKKKTKEDARYERFSSSDSVCKSEFEHYMDDLEKKAWSEFKSLLKETKLITHKSKTMINESDLHLRDIKEILKNDLRWLVLESMSEDRERILMDYIEDLHKRGPPPPPTATEPLDSRRKRLP